VPPAFYPVRLRGERVTFGQPMVERVGVWTCADEDRFPARGSSSGIYVARWRTHQMARPASAPESTR
jgi:hypothetical protein